MAGTGGLRRTGWCYVQIGSRAPSAARGSCSARVILRLGTAAEYLSCEPDGAFKEQPSVTQVL
jgi:hypothetical protein